MGDPSGVGGEIIAASLAQITKLGACVIVGDRWVFDKSTVYSPQSTDVRFVDLKNIRHKTFSFGKIKAEYGKASIEYLDKALELFCSNEIDCLVTCPISKEAIHRAGYKYSGHTEYLARKTSARQVEMMLLCQGLRFLLATRHIPLKAVPRALHTHALCQAIMLAYRSLISYFAVSNPRMVVCGLNPHASDNGIIGNEEARIIKPALRRLKPAIRHLDGPLPADAAISKAKHGEYDCVVAMYHDQALIPLKLLGGYSGVNLTLGLRFVRTSPLHGTAFDIAGTGQADPSSLIEAVKCALECTVNLKRV
jgi:4-hydroxythreonine-4-phosphate dehydrogenase